MSYKKRPGFEPGRFRIALWILSPLGGSRMTMSGRRLLRYARNDNSYFKNCIYGSLLASSCTLSALAMRAERACQEPSRN